MTRGTVRPNSGPMTSWLASANQRLRHKLGRSKEDTSERFNRLNAELKESRRFLERLEAEAESFHRASEDFISVAHRFSEALVSLSLSKDSTEVLGDAFVSSFRSSQEALLSMFESLVRHVVHRRASRPHRLCPHGRRSQSCGAWPGVTCTRL